MAKETHVVHCCTCDTQIELHYFLERPSAAAGGPTDEPRPGATFRHPPSPATCPFAGARLVVCAGRDHALVEAVRARFQPDELDAGRLWIQCLPNPKAAQHQVLPALAIELVSDRAAAEAFRRSAIARRAAFAHDWSRWLQEHPPAPPDRSLLQLRDQLAFTFALIGLNPAMEIPAG